MAELHFTQNLRRHTPCPRYSGDGATVAALLGEYFEQYPGVRNYILDDQGHVRHDVHRFRQFIPATEHIRHNPARPPERISDSIERCEFYDPRYSD